MVDRSGDTSSRPLHLDWSLYDAHLLKRNNTLFHISVATKEIVHPTTDDSQNHFYVSKRFESQVCR